MKIAIRGFAGGKKLFEERIESTGEDLDALACEHMLLLKDHPLHMIEFEFLDEPDPKQRFFRIGTDPSGMVIPIGIKLDE